MKKFILTLVLGAVISVSAIAQQRTAEARAKTATENMAKNLGLTEDQKTKIYAANLEKTNAIDAIKAAAGEGVKPDATLMKPVYKKFNDVLATTLTEEQKAKLQEMKANAPKPEAKPKTE